MKSDEISREKSAKTLVLIDGKSVFYRGYYAMPNLSTKSGIPTGGVYGFATLALELFAKIKPDFVAVCWDKPKTNIRRRLEIYDQYKANRKPAPPDFYAQIPILHELLAALNWPFYECDDYEADDIIGTFDKQANAAKVRSIMISSDLDLLQLVDENTELYALKKGLANLEKFDISAFEKKYGGLKVAQFLDLKSLKGDASDNIPGVAGVGEKTAINLLQNFGTLENIYANLNSNLIRESLREKLISGEKSAFMSKKLAKIWCDAPLKLNFEDADAKNFNLENLRAELAKLEFFSLLKKLPKFFENSENLAQNSENNLKKSREILQNPDVNSAKKTDEIAQNFDKKNSEKIENNFADFSQISHEILPAKIENLDKNSDKNFYKKTCENLQKNDIFVVEICEENLNENAKISENNFENSAQNFVEKGSEKVENSREKIGQNSFKNSAKKSTKNAEKINQNLLEKLDEIENPRAKFCLVSADEKIAYKTDFKTARDILTGKKIIAHDAKFFAEEFLKQNFAPNFVVFFDTKLAAFLLDSTRKSPTLEDAIFWMKTDEKNEIATMKNGEKIGAIWRLFAREKTELSKFKKLEKLAQNVDFPLQIIIAKIEKRGVKLDEKILQKMSGNLAKKIGEIETEIWNFAGKNFNISSPKQLSEILFFELKLPTFGIKKNANGNFATGKKELAKLREIHPIIDKITEVRELLKMKNTYVDALPNLVDENGFLHTDFRQDITATGRLSSSNPNLQNIPIRSEIGREIRRAFVASSGKILVSADYAQFELRLAAALSHDEKLIEIFNEDKIDIHTKTAADVFKIAPENVTKNQRRAAKVINFGVLYGMSPHSLAENTGMNFADAREFIEKYFEARKPLREFLDKTVEKAKTDGFVETLFGRRRKTSDVRAGNFAIREAAKRAAANLPFQGTEADLMKMAMIRVENEIPDAAQILQIHDSILVETAPENAEKVAEKLREIMENIYPPLGVKLKVDVKIGENWAEL